MTIDGLTLHFAVNELNEALTGCKVDKVHQPRPDTVVLSLRAPGKNLRLLVGAGAADSRMHLTEYKYQNPKKPPMFCMFLRKYISGAKVAEISQIGLERIVNISLEAKDELGLPRRLTLVCELMGKYSNVILVGEDGNIMDSLRHVTKALSRVRTVMPQLAYEQPQSSKLNLLNISRETLAEMLIKRGDAKTKAYLCKVLQGVSGHTAEEILCRYMPAGYEAQPKEAERLSDAILKFVDTLQTPQPTMYMRGSLPFFFSSVPYRTHAGCDSQSFPTANALLDAYYHRVREAAAVRQKRTRLQKQTRKQVTKLSQILKKQHGTLEKAKKAEKFKRYGDIITANIYRISPGMNVLDAEDYTTGETVSIPLDPRLSPAANAQKNYQKYNKRKAGQEITMKRMRKNQSEIAFLESVQISLDTSDTIEELKEIEYELSKAGVLPPRAAKHKATENPSKPMEFKSSDGIAFFAGKNNRQNDMLTMKTASPDDIWLHTQQIPGAHVLIKAPLESVPDQTLLEAAAVAAALSKAKGSQKVPVDYAPRKNVRKPNGSKPGMVVYEGYNTVIVDPDAELLARLRVR